MDHGVHAAYDRPTGRKDRHPDDVRWESSSWLILWSRDKQLCVRHACTKLRCSYFVTHIPECFSIKNITCETSAMKAWRISNYDFFLTVCIIEAKLWNAFFSGYQDIAILRCFEKPLSGHSATFLLDAKYRGVSNIIKMGHVRGPAKLIWGCKIWSCFQYLKNGICPGAPQNWFGEAKYRSVSIIIKMGYFCRWVGNFDFSTVGDNIHKVAEPSTGHFQE